MKLRRWQFPVVCMCGIFLAGQAGLAEDPVPADQLPAKLVSTWKMVSASYNGQQSDIPQRFTVFKHITPTHFTWVWSDPDSGVVKHMGSGTWTLEGTQLSEVPEIGIGDVFQMVKNQTHTFECKIVGDKWYHTGKLANGVMVEEVYERVKRE